MVLVEACVTSVQEARAASAAGADRLELCRELATGGLTPDEDVVAGVRAEVELPLFAMVRPRPGPYQMTAAEVAAMLRDIADMAALGVDGVVLGVLDKEGRIEATVLRDLVTASGPLPVTFHRAFDEVPDPTSAMECLEEAGVARVLTGGGAGAAWEGRETLRTLVSRSSRRPIVLAGGGVRGDHVARLVRASGATEVHARASAIAGVVEGLREVEGPSPTGPLRPAWGRRPTT